MTEDRKPSKIERNAPRIEQAARWLWDHRPKSNKAKIQILAAVTISGLAFGLGALESHGPAAKPASVTHSDRPASTHTPDPTVTPTATASSWTPGPAPGYGFVGGNPGDTGTTVPAASSSASPTPAPTVQPEPSETTIQPGPDPSSPGPNPSE